MGTDMSAVLQVRANGKWLNVERCNMFDLNVAWRMFEGRNYPMYGWLAGVRNYAGLEPIAADRGYPEDWVAPEWWEGEYGESWISTEELRAVKIYQIVEDRTIRVPIGTNGSTTAGTCGKGMGSPIRLSDLIGHVAVWDINIARNFQNARVVFAFNG